MSTCAPPPMRIDGISLVLDAAPLAKDALAPFGEVIASPQLQNLPPTAVPTNQGTAVKMEIAHMQNLCATAPSAGSGAPTMNFFVCKTRELVQGGAAERGKGEKSLFFPLSILERHPFTSQAFIPLGVCGSGSGNEDEGGGKAHHDQRRYLVMVAPTLPDGPADAHLPAPAGLSSPSLTPSSSSPSALPIRPYPGRGLPDLRRLRAFVATGAQGVSYRAGTWHSPMVALGPAGSAIDFVVIQSHTGVPLEDCQEVAFGPPPASLSPENAGARWGGCLIRVPAPRGAEWVVAGGV